MKRNRKTIYGFLDFAYVDDMNAAKRNSYKIRLNDTVNCYYLKIPGRIGKNIVAQSQKDVLVYANTKGDNVFANVCRIHDIDVDLTGFNFKEVSRKNEEEIRKTHDDRLMNLAFSTRAKR